MPSQNPALAARGVENRSSLAPSPAQDSYAVCGEAESHAAPLRHGDAMGPHVAFYNLFRVYETLRIKRVTAIGVTGRVWSIAEAIDAAML